MGTVIDSHFLALTAIVTVGYQFFFFIITALLKFDKVTDFAGSTNFVIIAVLTLVLKGSWYFRQIILTLLVILWGLRLGLFLLMRESYKLSGAFWRSLMLYLPRLLLPLPMISLLTKELDTGKVIGSGKAHGGLYFLESAPHPSHSPQSCGLALQADTGSALSMLHQWHRRILQWGEDRRFDEMRASLSKLAIFWTFQAVWVWTVSLPVTIVNASDRDPSVQSADIIGWIIWSIGISVEATADQQKLTFKNSPDSRGKWCCVGLWKYSRHPNYFGEILLWWGIFVAATPVLNGAEWLVVLGPLFLTLLLLFVSGIPLLEESADKKFGNVAGYRAYKSTTSPLIPLPPVIYGNLPSWFKKAFLLEFPFYSRNLPQEGLN